MKQLLVSSLSLLTLSACAGPLPHPPTVSTSPDTKPITKQATDIQANIRQEMSAFTVPTANLTITVPKPEQYPVPQLASQTVPLFPTVPVQATTKTSVPMKLQRLDRYNFIMFVADPNTARSAYGRKLRLYEVHLAKMFEITDRFCQDEGLDGVRWFYRVASVERGPYTIPCHLASQIKAQYGTTNKPEFTTIQMPEAGNWQQAVAVLKIADQKVDPWIVFCQRLQVDRLTTDSNRDS